LLWLKTATGRAPAFRKVSAGFFLNSEMLIDKSENTVSTNALQIKNCLELIIALIVAIIIAPRRAERVRQL
jgi:hypothetical protein